MRKTSLQEMAEGLKEKLKIADERRKGMIKCSKCNDKARFVFPAMGFGICEPCAKKYLPDFYKKEIQGKLFKDR